MLSKLNLEQAFTSIDDFWQPRIAAQLHGMAIKLVKVRGEFVWHHHDVEDEIFLVVRGQLTMRLQDGDVILNAGECLLVPHGVEHQPFAADDTWVMLIEPAETRNTGNIVSERTVDAVPL
jgi:mannose-6-phosphate isomerase-like protein (cupin superfamily)